MEIPSSRVEVFSLSLEYVKTVDYLVDDDCRDDPLIVDLNSCRIFISDGERLREIYNPVKLQDFYTDLPPGFPQKRAKHSTISRPNTSALPPLTAASMYENLQDSVAGKKRKYVLDSTSGGPIDLPLITDPDVDIRYNNFYFHLIVHQGNDHDLLRKKTKPLYITGMDARPEVRSYASTRKNLDFDEPTEVTYNGCLFRLTLDCIVFEESRVVTVSVTWLSEDIGGDGNEALICGQLYFRSSGCDKRIVLLNTPDGKAVKVVHDKPITLLRSVVAVPYNSTFTVEADLCHPINNSYVQDTVTFDTPVLNIFHEPPHQLLRGNGLKFKVEVTVKPNPPYDFFAEGKYMMRSFWEELEESSEDYESSVEDY